MLLNRFASLCNASLMFSCLGLNRTSQNLFGYFPFRLNVNYLQQCVASSEYFQQFLRQHNHVCVCVWAHVWHFRVLSFVNFMNEWMRWISVENPTSNVRPSNPSSAKSSDVCVWDLRLPFKNSLSNQFNDSDHSSVAPNVRFSIRMDFAVNIHSCCLSIFNLILIHQDVLKVHEVESKIELSLDV